MNTLQNSSPTKEQSPRGAGPIAIVVMWSIVGALASGGGTVVGAMIGAGQSSSCTDMFCGLEGAIFGGAAGWAVGVVLAVAASVLNGGGSAVDKIARALSALLGVVALPAILFIPTFI